VTTPPVPTLQQRRLAALQEARALAASAADEGRAFTDMERDLWDILNARIDALDDQIGQR
jgi:hypothetical protein